jgi:hypothetical protein
MSGFELLSVVRRRFPHIPVIVISSEYHGKPPQGLIADAFFSKTGYTPKQLFSKIADLLEQSPLRPHAARPDYAPVWVPRSAEGYFVVTCTQCLRSFSVPEEESKTELRQTHCLFCDATVRYLADAEAIHKKRPKAV